MELKSSSAWFSLIPLIAVNTFIISMAVIFRWVYRKRDRLKEVEERHASKFLNRWIREFWLWLTDPIVQFFVRFHFTPNSVTVIGVLLTFVSATFLARGNFGLGGWMMVIAASFDIFDGRVARATGQETKSGAYFDSVMDRVSESALFLGLALHYRNHWALWIVIIALAGSFMVSYAKAQGGANGVNYSGGSMQRPERVVYMGVGAIFAPIVGGILNFYVSFDSTDYVYLLTLSFVALMTWITTYDRISHVIKKLNEGV